MEEDPDSRRNKAIFNVQRNKNVRDQTDNGTGDNKRTNKELHFLFTTAFLDKPDDSTILKFLHRISEQSPVAFLVDVPFMNEDLQSMSKYTREWTYVAKFKQLESLWLPVCVKNFILYKPFFLEYLKSTKFLICYGIKLAELVDTLNINNMAIFPIGSDVRSNDFIVDMFFKIYR